MIHDTPEAQTQHDPMAELVARLKRCMEIFPDPNGLSRASLNAIEALVKENACLNTLLKVTVIDSEKENAELRKERDAWKAMQDALYYLPLAESQAREARLREALDDPFRMIVIDDNHAETAAKIALAFPQDSSALNEALKTERKKVGKFLARGYALIGVTKALRSLK